MVYQRYAYESGTRAVYDQYTVCGLFNSSYDVDLSFNEGFQVILPKNITQLNEIDYPDATPTPYSHDLMVQYAYCGYFWAITDLLVGSMDIHSDNAPNNSMPTTNFIEVTTGIEYTNLLGTSYLDIFFDGNGYFRNTTMLSSRILEGFGLARNGTLDALIQELGFNVTMSLLSDELLS
jgi:hypothetical protein